MKATKPGHLGYVAQSGAIDLAVIGDVPAWFADAVCYGSSADFFPKVTTGREASAKAVEAYAAAKAVCARCPVRAECAAYAVENDERHGVWGGLTPDERGVPGHYRSM